MNIIFGVFHHLIDPRRKFKLLCDAACAPLCWYRRCVGLLGFALHGLCQTVALTIPFIFPHSPSNAGKICHYCYVDYTDYHVQLETKERERFSLLPLRLHVIIVAAVKTISKAFLPLQLSRDLQLELAAIGESETPTAVALHLLLCNLRPAAAARTTQ